jgi:hypothetical protein
MKQALAVTSVAAVLFGVCDMGVAADHFINAAGLPWYKNINPHGVYHNGKTYVVFEHISNDPYIMAYHHDDKTWSKAVKVGTNPLRGDGHGNPAMWIDPDGFIHVTYGGHGVPRRDQQRHAKSAKPEDITSWKQLPVIDVKCTYPQVCRFADSPKKVLIFYRRGSQGKGLRSDPWGYRLSDDGGNTFGEFIQVTDGRDMDMYAQAAVAPNGTLHVCISNVEKGGEGFSRYGRNHVYYLYQSADGDWCRADGEAVTSFPVNGDYVRKHLRVYETGGTMFTPSMEFDRDSTLYIGFNDSGTGKFISGKKPFDSDRFTFTQVADGCDNWSDDAWLFVCSPQEMYFYVGAHGEGGAGHNGGVLEEWKSTDGEKWTFSRKITEFDHAWSVTRVHNAHDDARILFTRTDNWKLYLYGASGFLGNPGRTSLK